MNTARMLVIAMLISVSTACGKSESPTAAKASASASAPEQGGDQGHDAKGKETHAGEARDAHAGEAGGHDEHGENRLTLTADEAAKAGIKLAKLEPRQVASTLQLTANITANRDRVAHIAPRVSGKLVKVMASLGDKVKAGQPLALVDSIEIGQANSEYLQARSTAELARANLARAESLNAEQIIPQKDFLSARSEAERADAALRAAEDRLRVLGVGLPTPDGRAQSVYSLVAPFAGTIIEKDAVLGELAQPDKELLTLADLSKVWIEADLFEKDLAQVNKGAQASVTVTAYPGETFAGRVTYVSDVLDKETRTAKARVVIDNRAGRLKPGMFATANVTTTALTDALTVPEQAVLLMDGKPTLFVREAGGFEPRTVELGPSAGGVVAVYSGVEPGEEVVVAGAYELKARLLKSELGEGHAH